MTHALWQIRVSERLNNLTKQNKLAAILHEGAAALTATPASRGGGV